MVNARSQIRAIIAEDEAPSRVLLKSQLQAVWPELIICGEAENGIEAKKMIELMRPDFAFLDIKMPGLSGMQVARETAGVCRVVFVTGYDKYAVDAFENEAVDYILKPATPERLEKTVQRLKDQIASESPVNDISEILERIMSKMNNPASQGYLRWVRAQDKDGLRLIPADQVFFFKAKDKYTVVMTKDREYLIKKTITELSEELDPNVFFRIHRGTIVNANYIDCVNASESGRGQIRLKERSEVHMVSRQYDYLFKKM